MNWLTLFSLYFLIVLAYMTTLWLVSLAKKDSSIVDIFWGLGFVVLAVVSSFLADGYLPRRLLITALVTVWGLRLSLRILVRNWSKPEDPRYRAWREAAGPKYWWFSYIQVFLVQGFIMWLLSTPILTAQVAAAPARFTALDALGLAFWSIGLFFEAVGDWQLDRFKSDPANKGKIMRTGLWAYTRHPNYFGDSMVWWGFFLIAAATPAGLWTIYSPLLMTYLLVKVSGVALLEKSMRANRPGYEDYARTTSAFIPWFPRQAASDTPSKGG